MSAGRYLGDVAHQFPGPYDKFEPDVEKGIAALAADVSARVDEMRQKQLRAREEKTATAEGAAALVLAAAVIAAGVTESEEDSVDALAEPAEIETGDISGDGAEPPDNPPVFQFIRGRAGKAGTKIRATICAIDIGGLTLIGAAAVKPTDVPDKKLGTRIAEGRARKQRGYLSWCVATADFAKFFSEVRWEVECAPWQEPRHKVIMEAAARTGLDVNVDANDPDAVIGKGR